MVPVAIQKIFQQHNNNLLSLFILAGSVLKRRIIAKPYTGFSAITYKSSTTL